MTSYSATSAGANPLTNSVKKRWFIDDFLEAVRRSRLNPYEREVARAFTEWARNEKGRRGPDANLAALTYTQIMEITGIGRRERVAKTLASLIKKGWLQVVKAARRRSTLFRMTIPGAVDPTTDKTTGDASKVADNAADQRKEAEEPGSSGGGTTSTGNEPGEGTSVVPDRNYGSSGGGTPLLRSSETPPLTPPGEPPAGAEGEQKGEGEIIENRKTKIVEAVRQGKRIFWGRRHVRKAIEEALADGHTLDAIEIAFPIVAALPDTNWPSRLHKGQGDWWKRAYAQLHRATQVEQPPRRPARPASDVPEMCATHPGFRGGRNAAGLLLCFGCRREQDANRPSTTPTPESPLAGELERRIGELVGAGV